MEKFDLYAIEALKSAKNISTLPAVEANVLLRYKINKYAMLSNQSTKETERQFLRLIKLFRESK